MRAEVRHTAAAPLSPRHLGAFRAAYNLHVQGRHHLNQRTEEGLRKAVEFFEKAIVEDTQYAHAYSGLADASFGENIRRASGHASQRPEVAYRDRHGSLWFGAARLTPMREEPSAGPPAIRITRIRVRGVEQAISELGESRIDGLRLRPAENQVQIEFASLNFGVGETIRYQYTSPHPRSAIRPPGGRSKRQPGSHTAFGPAAASGSTIGTRMSALPGLRSHRSTVESGLSSGSGGTAGRRPRFCGPAALAPSCPRASTLSDSFRGPVRELCSSTPGASQW
jgi:hypothetical protein